MIDRYSRPEMQALWTDQARYATWLRVELAVCEVLAERGVIPAASLAVIREKAGFDVARIAEIERTVKHDVIAFTTSVAEHVGPDSRFIHYVLTSSDVIDTALALQVRAAGDLLLAGCDRALAALRRRAREHRNTACVGRTHGIHAEPTTFGLKLVVLHETLRRGRERLARAIDECAVGKISGAVGTFAHLDPSVEQEVCARLGIGFESASTQVVQRDRHAAFVNALALVGVAIEQGAVEFRHLARTEVREVEEPFSKGQKGSSAMPHKRNPWRFETLTGLSRVLRGYATSALENVALWHERDISNSSVERIVFPDASLVADFMLHRYAGLVDGLVVYPDRMRENLESSRGLVFSGTLLLLLAEKGLTREDAYALVQGHAMDTWEKGGQFRDRILADADVARVLTKEEIENAFDLDEALRNVDAIFARTIGLQEPEGLAQRAAGERSSGDRE